MRKITALNLMHSLYGYLPLLPDERDFAYNLRKRNHNRSTFNH